MSQDGVAVPVTDGKGQIFGSPMESLDERGLVTAEYFLEGTAVSYTATEGSELGVDGLWDVDPAAEASPSIGKSAVCCSAGG